MTLDEAIRHCEEKAQQCGYCCKDHAQLAEWLKELKRLKEAERVTLWIARNDKDGFNSINVFQHEPRVSKFGRYFVPSKEDLSTNLLPQDGVFSSVTFENSPQKVELRLIGK
jgi:hypothetical protein